ncbi:MAG TPA: hypothetical protein VHA33_19290 [Candidatus Angelobacter sp.]|jgi:Fe2+ or Zn2+ uptake regulation protein|nr:hypothetical protein [Candidatus Angelobacter sp.]
MSLTEIRFLSPLPGQFRSAREACMSALRNARASCGRPLPMTAEEIHKQLKKEGMALRTEDINAWLRELSQEGMIQEIDAEAGFRWTGLAA